MSEENTTPMEVFENEIFNNIMDVLEFGLKAYVPQENREAAVAMISGALSDLIDEEVISQEEAINSGFDVLAKIAEKTRTSMDDVWVEKFRKVLLEIFDEDQSKIQMIVDIVSILFSRSERKEVRQLRRKIRRLKKQD